MIIAKKQNKNKTTWKRSNDCKSSLDKKRRNGETNRPNPDLPLPPHVLQEEREIQSHESVIPDEEQRSFVRDILPAQEDWFQDTLQREGQSSQQGQTGRFPLQHLSFLLSLLQGDQIIHITVQEIGRPVHEQTQEEGPHGFVEDPLPAEESGNPFSDLLDPGEGLLCVWDGLATHILLRGGMPGLTPELDQPEQDPSELPGGLSLLSEAIQETQDSQREDQGREFLCLGFVIHPIENILLHNTAVRNEPQEETSCEEPGVQIDGSLQDGLP